MIKTTAVKVKSIENEEITTTTIITTLIMTIIKIIMMTVRIKIGNRIKIQKR